MPKIDVLPMWPLLATALAFLVPWGISLLVAGGLRPQAARHVALTPLTAFVLASVGYVFVGFGLHFGGIGLVIDHPDLAGLVWEWSALNANWGATWGMAGAAGFALQDAQTPVAYLLLLTTLPWATTATLLPLLALRGRAPRVVVALVGLLVAGVGYPLVGNWIQGGGWLSWLGANIGAGRGFIDIGGGSVFLLGGSVILAAMLLFVPPSQSKESDDALPPVHLPLLAVAGAGLVLAGSAGWLLASPLNDWTQMSAVQAVLFVLLAAAGGGAAPLFYTWFVANQPDALQGARGVVAGWVTGLALGPLSSPLWALGAGLVAGLLVVLGTYLLARWLAHRDPGALLTTFALPALWGLLVAGLGAGGSRVPDGQWQVQALGAAVILLMGFLATVVITGPLVLVARAWSPAPATVDEEGPALEAD